MNYRTALAVATLLVCAVFTSSVAADKPSSKSTAPTPAVAPPGGGMVQVSGTTTLGAGAQFVMCTVGAGSYTITLPPASATGQRLTVMITNYTCCGSVDFAGQGSDQIINGIWGQGYYDYLGALGGTVEFISNGNGTWFVMSGNSGQGIGKPNKPPTNPPAKN